METSIDIATAENDIKASQSLCFPPEVWSMIGELVPPSLISIEAALSFTG
jgi:hypothetical protein